MQNVYVGPPAAPGPPKSSFYVSVGAIFDENARFTRFPVPSVGRGSPLGGGCKTCAKLVFWASGRPRPSKNQHSGNNVGAELGASCVRRGGGIGAPRRWIEIRCSSTSEVVTVVMLVVRRMVMTVTGASKAPKACKK